MYITFEPHQCSGDLLRCVTIASDLLRMVTGLPTDEDGCIDGPVDLYDNDERIARIALDVVDLLTDVEQSSDQERAGLAGLFRAAAGLLDLGADT